MVTMRSGADGLQTMCGWRVLVQTTYVHAQMTRGQCADNVSWCGWHTHMRRWHADDVWTMCRRCTDDVWTMCTWRQVQYCMKFGNSGKRKRSHLEQLCIKPNDGLLVSLFPQRLRPYKPIFCILMMSCHKQKISALDNHQLMINVSLGTFCP